jgi:nitroreductase
MNVTEAVERRISVRAFKSDPAPAALVREILEIARRAPSGGNLQPWRVHALAGEPLAELKALAAAKMAQGGEPPEYDVYPENLWEPFRTRRFQCGEDLYASINIPREDRPARLRQLANNVSFFGAPVGLFFSLERKLGRPQWADVGMYMQTVMLLAAERGLDTCAQEFWARLPKTVSDFIGLPEDHMLFSGMAMGYRDPDAPINGWRTRRDDFDLFAEMRGF